MRTTATPEVITWVSSTCGSVKDVEVSYSAAGFREQHLLYSMEATINAVEAYWLTLEHMTLNRLVSAHTTRVSLQRNHTKGDMESADSSAGRLPTSHPSSEFIVQTPGAWHFFFRSAVGQVSWLPCHVCIFLLQFPPPHHFDFPVSRTSWSTSRIRQPICYY